MYRVYCGQFHSLIIENGKILTFGRNDKGQLGTNDLKNKNFPHYLSLKLFNNKTIIDVSGGDFHTLFLTENGKVLCCGYNGCHQLPFHFKSSFYGKDQLLPIYIDCLSNYYIKQLSAGGYHNLYVSNNGKVLSNGRNDEGQLGLGSFNYQKNGIANEIKFENDIFIIKVYASGCHSLFLTKYGKVYACGRNNNGQLGIGCKKNMNIPKIVKFSETIKIIQISGGEYHSLFLDERGKVYGTGFNAYGQLGVGEKKEVLFPTIIQGLKDYKIVKMVAFGNHSMFLDCNGNVHCLGSNGYGSFGIGNEKNIKNPITNEVLREKIVDIAIGSTHALFLSDSENFYSSGLNSRGQLGVGSENKKTNIPLLIKKSNFKKLETTKKENVKVDNSLKENEVNELDLNRYGKEFEVNRTIIKIISRNNSEEIKHLEEEMKRIGGREDASRWKYSFSKSNDGWLIFNFSWWCQGSSIEKFYISKNIEKLFKRINDKAPSTCHVRKEEKELVLRELGEQ